MRRLLELDHEALSLKRMYNMMSPPCRLPTEILSKIFVDLTELYKGRDPHLWIGITFVCHYWRVVATDFPPLWTNLPFINPAFTELALSRTKGALLSISHEFEPETPGDHDAVTQLILAHTARLRCIDLSSVEVCDAPSLGAGHLFLTKLSLQRCRISWEALPLPEGLTELCLVLDGSVESFLSLPWLEELLVSLRRLGFLRKLELSRYIPIRRSGVRSLEESPTTLPALQEIYLKDSALQVKNFLDSIQIPNVALVDISLLDMHSAVRYAPQFFMALKTSWRDGEQSHLSGLRFFEIKREPQGSPLWGDIKEDSILYDCGFADRDDGCPPRRLKLQVGDAEAPTDTLDGILGTFTSELDFSHLLNLSIGNSNHILTSVTWRALFKTLTHLRTITLVHRASHWISITKLLKEANEVPSQRGAAVPLKSFLPSLSELAFIDMNFRNWDQKFADFVAALLRRSELEPCLPALKLTFLNCFITISGEKLLCESLSRTSTTYEIIGVLEEDSEGDLEDKDEDSSHGIDEETHHGSQDESDSEQEDRDGGHGTEEEDRDSENAGSSYEHEGEG